jgi:isopenicillin N synthase-like dioxygenase
MGPSQPAETTSSITGSSKFNLSEPNVWPDDEVLPSKQHLEQLYTELQTLSSDLLSLLAMSLGKSSDFFAPYLQDSLSTLRLLHYPPISSDRDAWPDRGGRTYGSVPASPPPEPEEPVKLSCTPHTDSGILTLLHQDPTGGLEVQDSSGKWVPAPYVPESLVVNIGDLMAKVSGGRFVATMHRVRAPPQRTIVLDGDEMSSSKFGRFSVPFFFEPGEKCIVRPVDGNDEAIVYGEHVRAKMMTWVEFRDDVAVEPISSD